jgi:hypothetical protein
MVKNGSTDFLSQFLVIKKLDLDPKTPKSLDPEPD